MILALYLNFPPVEMLHGQMSQWTPTPVMHFLLVNSGEGCCCGSSSYSTCDKVEIKSNDLNWSFRETTTLQDNNNIKRQNQYKNNNNNKTNISLVKFLNVC